MHTQPHVKTEWQGRRKNNKKYQYLLFNRWLSLDHRCLRQFVHAAITNSTTTTTTNNNCNRTTEAWFIASEMQMPR